MASDHANTCLYPSRDPDTACGYAHSETASTEPDEETETHG